MIGGLPTHPHILHQVLGFGRASEHSVSDPEKEAARKRQTIVLCGLIVLLACCRGGGCGYCHERAGYRS